MELVRRTRLERVRHFIDRHYSERLDLDRLAREAGLSPSHFLRCFKRRFGETPHRYLTRRRIRRSQELLRSGDLSVTEICLEVGLESLGSFSSLFHRWVGEPPARYRRRLWQSHTWRLEQAERAIPFCFASAFLAGQLRSHARGPVESAIFDKR